MSGKCLVLIPLFFCFFTVAHLAVVPIACAGFAEASSAYGRGDYATAYAEIKPLAEQGNRDAQYNLGLMYESGQGVPQDNTEASKWYGKAAGQGSAEAQNSLGLMYNKGQGVPQDSEEAGKWFRKAAEQGLAAAQCNLGDMCAGGKGVPQDLVQAHMWFSLAAEQEDLDAQKARDNLAAMMTPSQIEEAQRLAREWKTKGKD